MFAVSSDGKQVAKLTRATPYLDLSPTPGSGASPQRFVVPQNTTPANWLSATEFVAVSHPLPASIERVSLADGTIRSITPLDSNGVGDAFYSPDGKRFAYTRYTDTGVQLIVADADGSHARALGVASSIGHISWSPSGAQIAYL
jgi:Tol biopolymer transport system component